MTFLDPDRKMQFTQCIVVGSVDTSKIANTVYSLEHTTKKQQRENIIGQLKATSQWWEQTDAIRDNTLDEAMLIVKIMEQTKERVSG